MRSRGAATPNLHIYVADTDFATPLSDAIEEAGLREVGEGGRIVFWAADTRVFACARRVAGIPLVSAPRLHADLSSLGGRGVDAADHVKAELIDPMHPRPDAVDAGGAAFAKLGVEPYLADVV